MIEPTYFYGTPSVLTASTLVHTGPGTVQAVIVSSHTSGTLKLWDSLVGSGTVLVDTITYAAGSSSIPFYGPKFLTGLFADMNSTVQKITLIWDAYNG